MRRLSWKSADPAQAKLILSELQEEIERFSGLEPWMKVRHGIVMAKLMECQGDKVNAAQAARIALENLAQTNGYSLDNETRSWAETLRDAST